MVSLKRQLPKIKDFAPLLKFKVPDTNATRRRLSSAYTIEDLRRIAKRRTPIGPFDYTEGGADHEISIDRSRQAFMDVEFQPGILRDVTNVDMTTTVLGKQSTLPFGMAPTGFTRMMHSAGERAVASAAANAGIPYSLSTVGTTSIEDVAAAAPGGRKWFQLYLWKNRDLSLELMQNAKKAGYDTLIITVDVPTPGNRIRDLRNGMSIPPSSLSRPCSTRHTDRDGGSTSSQRSPISSLSTERGKERSATSSRRCTTPASRLKTSDGFAKCGRGP